MLRLFSKLKPWPHLVVILLQIFPCGPLYAPPEDLPALNAGERALLEYFIRRATNNPFRGVQIGELVEDADLSTARRWGEDLAVVEAFKRALINVDINKILKHAPELAERIERGRAIRNEHYRDLAKPANDFVEAGAKGDLIDEIEQKLLEKIKLARKYREVKLKEYEAAILARESTKRRLGGKMDPELARQWLDAKTALTATEESLARYSLKLHAMLTQYYMDETKLTKEKNTPPEIVQLWKKEAKEMIQAHERGIRRLYNQINGMRNEEMHMSVGWDAWQKQEKDRLSVPESLHGEVGVQLLQSLVAARAALGRAADPALGDAVKTPEQALAALEQAKPTQEKARRDAKLAVDSLRRGTQFGKNEWVDALGWWHAGVVGEFDPNKEMTKDEKGKVAEDMASLRKTLGMPEVKDANLPKPPSKLKGPLKWAAAALLGLGLLGGVGHVVAPHIPRLFDGAPRVTITNPFRGENPSHVEQSQRPHQAGNFGMVPGQGQPRDLYEINLRGTRDLNRVPTDFEYAFLEERNGPREAYRFERGERAAEFDAVTKLSIRPQDGWFAVTHTRGFDSEVKLSSKNGNLVEGVDYRVWQTESGALLVQLLKDKNPPDLKETTSLYKAKPKNPVPEKDLALTPAELRTLIDQAREMEAKGMTELSQVLRERAQAALDGKGTLKVTDIAHLVHGNSVYTEMELGRVRGEGKAWGDFVDIPIENGKLVMQCSVADRIVRLIVENVIKRPGWKMISVHVLRRQDGKGTLSAHDGHVYPVLKPGEHDGIVMDGTPSLDGPKSVVDQKAQRRWYQMPEVHAAAAATLAALGLGYLALRRRRKPIKEELQEREEKAQKEEEAKKTRERIDPLKGDPRNLAMQRRNDQRRRQVEELHRRQKRLLDYAEAYGIRADGRFESFPLRLASETAALIRDFVNGDKEFTSRDQLIERIAKIFHFDAEEIKEASGGSVRKAIDVARKKLKKQIERYGTDPSFKRYHDQVEANTMRQLDSMLAWMGKEAWTPMEKYISAAGGGACSNVSGAAAGGGGV